MAEQRRDARIDMVVRVDYPDDPGGVDWAENISASGLFVRTEKSFVPGEAVRLALTFPGGCPPLILSGTVVWVRSQGLRGVGFRVDSPLQRKQLTDNLLQASAAHRPGGGSYIAFVVEDNRNYSEMLQRSLAQLSAVRTGALRLSFFENGFEALNAATATFPDLVVTDIDMPIMDGLALIRRLRMHPDGQRIAILAMGVDESHEGRAALTAGADGFLAKPFSVGSMLGLLTGLLLTVRSGETIPAEILAVDDEQDNLDILARILAGRRLRTFVDPHEALNAALAVKPKVMLVDYKMPELDGVTLVQRLREGGEGRCSVVIVTAYPDLDEVVYARQSQLFYRLVPKPIDSEFLRSQVDTAIEEYARRSESLRRFLTLSHD